MSEFTCLLGGSAFSGFQKQKLSDSLEVQTGSGFSFEAHHIYFVESTAALDSSQQTLLESLLPAKVSGLFAGENILLVLPRMGTQSPWSTKATDIARRCGLQQVERIERGTLFRLPAELPDEEHVQTMVALVHDRMTQTVLRDVSAAQAMFDHPQPRPLVI